jgi:hypothetical protein
MKKIEFLDLPLTITSAWIAFLMHHNNGNISEEDWEIVINWMKWVSESINNYNSSGLPIDINGIESGLNYMIETNFKHLTVKRNGEL